MQEFDGDLGTLANILVSSPHNPAQSDCPSMQLMPNSKPAQGGGGPSVWWRHQKTYSYTAIPDE